MDDLELRRETKKNKEASIDSFYINGRSLADLIGEHDYVSPLGWLDIHPDHNFRAMLTLSQASDFRPERVPLLVCPECAAYDCSLITVRIDRIEDTIVWSDFRWERDYDDWSKPPDAGVSLRFDFDLSSYMLALSQTNKGEQVMDVNRQ